MLKINELIGQQLGQVISREVEMPDIFVTITRVTTSAHLKYSTVYVSVMPDDKLDYAVNKLNLLSKRLRGELAEKVVLRSLPRLEFRSDKTGKEASDIDALLDQIKAEVENG
jgi:ribosome-binding factor A